MKVVASSGVPTHLVFLLTVLAGSVGVVRADGINFLGLPSQQVQSIDVDGVTITGSNTLVINDAPGATASGLSILGGVSGIGDGDGLIDPTESVTFHFNSGPAGNIVLTPLLLGTLGSGSFTTEGESVITAFGASGQSLGAVALFPSSDTPRTFNISSAFNNQPIAAFTFQPEGNAINGNFASLASMAFSAVPEPSSLLAWGAGAMIALGHVLTRRRRGRGEVSASRS